MKATISEAGFKAWMIAVDAACWKRWACSIHDLPDVPFREWYEDGKKPAAAADAAARVAMD